MKALRQPLRSFKFDLKRGLDWPGADQSSWRYFLTILLLRINLSAIF